MGQTHYSQADHKKAFDIYSETKSYARVVQHFGCTYGTARNWSKGDYKCKFPGCPWHDWDRLMAARDRALTAKLDLYAQVNLHPEAHDRAIRDAVGKCDDDVGLTADRREIVQGLVRGDLERLAHFEYLWTKVMYHVSGVALDMHALIGPDGEPLEGDDLKVVMDRGLKFSNMGQGITALIALNDVIDAKKEKLGIQRPTQSAIEQTEAPKLTVEETRKFLQLLGNTPPEEQQLLLKIMRADAAALQTLRDQTMVVDDVAEAPEVIDQLQETPQADVGG